MSLSQFIYPPKYCLLVEAGLDLGSVFAPWMSGFPLVFTEAWLQKAVAPVQDDSSTYTKLLKDEVTRAQLRMSHTFLNVFLGILVSKKGPFPKKILGGLEPIFRYFFGVGTYWN